MKIFKRNYGFAIFRSITYKSYINENLKGDNFWQLYINNKIKKTDFSSWQQLNIDFLIDNDVISVDKENIFITQKQSLKLLIISNIYNYGVIHYYNFNKKLR